MNVVRRLNPWDESHSYHRTPRWGSLRYLPLSLPRQHLEILTCHHRFARPLLNPWDEFPVYRQQPRLGSSGHSAGDNLSPTGFLSCSDALPFTAGNGLLPADSSQLDPFLGRQEKAVPASLFFNSLEFEGIKIGVIKAPYTFSRPKSPSNSRSRSSSARSSSSVGRISRYLLAKSCSFPASTE